MENFMPEISKMFQDKEKEERIKLMMMMVQLVWIFSSRSDFVLSRPDQQSSSRDFRKKHKFDSRHENCGY